ncbi:MAG: DMT family transporter [Spirochaetota bacterium]
MPNSRTLKSLFLPHAALIATVLFWGMSFSSSKVVLNTGFPPLSLAFIRFLLASMHLFPVLKMREPETKITRKTLLPLMLSGLFGVTVYFFFENTGIKYTTASSAALIIGSIPIFTIGADYLLYRQSVEWYRIGGVFISLAGVYLLIGNPGGVPLRPGMLLGNLLMLGACLSWVAYIQFSRNLKTDFSGISLTTYQVMFGTVFLLPLALAEHRSWIMVGPKIWLNIFYLGIFCSAVCYFLYLYALARLETIVVSSYINVIPVAGAAGGVVLLGENLTPVQLLGGAVVITGVLIVNLKYIRQ